MMRNQIEAFEARLQKTRLMQERLGIKVHTGEVKPVMEFLRPGNSVIGTVGEATRRAAHGGTFDRLPRFRD